MSRIQIRRGAAADWTSANPVLYAGEFGYESDTGKYKLGDGSTAWTSLAYLPLTATGDVNIDGGSPTSIIGNVIDGGTT